jgi:hypothetical protein
VSRALLAQDSTRLQDDMTAARALPSPPDLQVAAVWARSLQELTSDALVLDSATVRTDPAAVARVHQVFTGAGGDLLLVGAAVQSGG